MSDETSNATDYPAAVADRIAETVREGEPLTFDQLGEVADTWVARPQACCHRMA